MTNERNRGWKEKYTAQDNGADVKVEVVGSGGTYNWMDLRMSTAILVVVVLLYIISCHAY